jgi:hypothetical protein
MRNDRRRYNTIAEDLIMAGAHGLEWAFDGKKTYFGFVPNLVGWHNTVAVRLRQMKYDTSAIVSDIVRDYNMGSATRVALEIIPSAFLYSKMRTGQSTDIISQADVDRAQANIAAEDDE